MWQTDKETNEPPVWQVALQPLAPDQFLDYNHQRIKWCSFVYHIQSPHPSTITHHWAAITVSHELFKSVGNLHLQDLRLENIIVTTVCPSNDHREGTVDEQIFSNSNTERTSFIFGITFSICFHICSTAGVRLITSLKQEDQFMSVITNVFQWADIYTLTILV